MHGMQGRRCRRRHPCTIRACCRVTYLLVNHISHHIRHGPHAFTNLSLARKPTSQTYIYIPIFISADPGSLFHIPFADHRPCFHRGMNFITCSIEEPCIDKHNAIFRSADTFFQINSGAAFFVHNTNLHGALRQANHIFNSCKDFNSKSHLFWAMHFRLHNVN